MSFLEIAQARQSCRAYDETKEVEQEKLEAILEAARLAPSACNGQPYHITVCRGQAAQDVALACRGLGMNKFATQAPITLVISEMPYVKSAAMGARVKGNDYRSYCHRVSDCRGMRTGPVHLYLRLAGRHQNPGDL